MQLVIAGKSHPADEGGKKMIQEMVRFADDPEVRHRIVFLPNYDIAMAQPLYPGCDVWLNNPLRPYEACGTSGMKAALNGGLNLSILDGWWDEWYDGNNGWSIPSADGVDDEDHRDDIEATALYDLIENEVAPRFYDEDEEGTPVRWIEMVRHTLKSLGPKVLADRMVRDYVMKLYSPSAQSSRTLNGDYAGAQDLADWKHKVRAGWSGVAIDHVESSGVADAPELGETLEVRAFVSLGGLSPDDVDVQVVHGRVKHEDDLVDTSVASLAPGGDLRGRTPPFRGHRRAGHHRARSATRCGCCRRTSTSRHPPSWAASRSRRTDLAEHDQGARARSRSPRRPTTRLADRVTGVGAQHDLAGPHPLVGGQLGLAGVGVRVEPQQERRVVQLLAAGSG